MAVSKKIFAHIVYIFRFLRILYTGKLSQSVIDKTQSLKRNIFFSLSFQNALVVAACFSVTLIVLFAIHGAESGTCDKTNVCSAIKAMETKLEAKLQKLLVLLSPPGKLGLTDRHRNSGLSVVSFSCT